MVNQVTMYVPTQNEYTIDTEATDSLDHTELPAPVTSEEGVRVALGNTWCHAVNTRITLQYRDNVYREVRCCKRTK